MPVSSLQGYDSPFPIVVAANSNPLAPPPIEAFSDDKPIVITTDRSTPVYGAVYWLASPRGRGRYAISADARGNVAPNLVVHYFHIGSPGATIDQLDKHKLDLSGAHIRLLARGFVRVDHLKDADGKPLGVPSRDVQRDAQRWHEYKMGLLDVDRMRQLQQELSASEDGRTLLAEWNPRIPRSVEVALTAPGKKTLAEIQLDRKLADDMREKVKTIADKIRDALEPVKPVEPTPAHASKSTEATDKTAQADAKGES